jgi:hypothetical protein
MSDVLATLYEQLNAKIQEIVALLANVHGYSAIERLDPQTVRSLEEEVDELIEAYDDAQLDGDPRGQWRAPGDMLAGTEISRLLQEHHEISEQILDEAERIRGLGEED